MVASPASDDSLSSVGASTEPLPASDPPRMSSPDEADDQESHSSSTAIPANEEIANSTDRRRRHSDQDRTGDESSLTEQTSSDGDHSRQATEEQEDDSLEGALDEDDSQQQNVMPSTSASLYNSENEQEASTDVNGTLREEPQSNIEEEPTEDNESSYSDHAKARKGRKERTPQKKRGQPRISTPMIESAAASDAEMASHVEQDDEEEEAPVPQPAGRRGRARGGRNGAQNTRNTKRNPRGKAASLKRARSASTETEQAEEAASQNGSSTSDSAPLVVTAKKRKTSGDAQAGIDGQDPTTASAEITALDALAKMSAPATGVVPLSEDPKTMVNQLKTLQTAADDDLAELQRLGIAPMDDASVAGETNDDAQTQDGIDEAGNDESETVVEKPSKPAPRKRGGARPRGKKGKEKVVEAEPKEDDAGDEAGTPAGSEPDEESDAAAVRRRAEAMEELAQIEINFAKLRDQLYIQRMRDNERDREEIEKGTHPELLHLTNMIEIRRSRRLELARKWLDGLEETYERQRVANEHTIWTWWSDERASLRTRMLDEANSKRRRLDREKRYHDRPKDDLSSALAPRPLPVVPLDLRRRIGMDSEPLSEQEIAWAIRHKDVRADPSVTVLDDESVLTDLERMELREPSRKANVFPPYEPAYAGGMSAVGNPFGDGRGQPVPYAQHYGPGYDSIPGMAQPHPFASGALGPLPPLPNGGPARVGEYGHDSQPGSRPPSNPRSSAYAKEGRNQGRSYSTHPFPASYAELDADRAGWKQKLGSAGPQGGQYGGYDEGTRWRQNSGPHQLGEPADIVSDPHGRRQNGDASLNGKPRFTLDDHMAVSRSPKGATSAAAAQAAKNAASLGGVNPYAPMPYGSPQQPSAASNVNEMSSHSRHNSRSHIHDHLPTAGAPKLAYGDASPYPSYFGPTGAAQPVHASEGGARTNV